VVLTMDFPAPVPSKSGMEKKQRKFLFISQLVSNIVRPPCSPVALILGHSCLFLKRDI